METTNPSLNDQRDDTLKRKNTEGLGEEYICHNLQGTLRSSTRKRSGSCYSSDPKDDANKCATILLPPSPKGHNGRLGMRTIDQMSYQTIRKPIL